LGTSQILSGSGEDFQFYFDRYEAFRARYRALTGDDFSREQFDHAESGEPLVMACPTDYPNAPRFKEILEIVWVYQSDFTGRTFACIFEHHLKQGTRIRFMTGGKFSIKSGAKSILDDLAQRYPLFTYKIHDGDDTSLLGFNQSLHVKSVVARGVDPKDDFVMIGGRNLSDRYYFRKFPDVVGGEEKEKDFVFYFDLEVASHYSPAVTEAYRADLALWHRLSDNFSFEPGIPLSFQLKQLLWSPKFEHMKSLEKSVQSQFLERLYSDLGLLRVLTLTTFKNGNVEHSSAISILRTVKSTIADFLTTPTVRSIYTEQGRSAQNSLLSTLRTRLADTKLFDQIQSAAVSHGLTTKRDFSYDQWFKGFEKALSQIFDQHDLSRVDDYFEISGGRIEDPLALDRRGLQNLESKAADTDPFAGDKIGLGSAVRQISTNEYWQSLQADALERQAVPDGPFARHITSLPLQDARRIERLFIELILSTKTSIRMVNCFFHPTENIIRALKSAADRGVHVFVTTNTRLTKDDFVELPEQANASGINKLYGYRNIHFYDWVGGILHPKAYLFDDEVAFIGSVNMNKRTLKYNTETGFFIADQAFINRFKTELYETHFSNTGAHPVPGVHVEDLDKAAPNQTLLYQFLFWIFNGLL
jgi:phosphatidylserine/phosphatidylglycerophosphate/cardiolipin synthase-like enzyme